MKPEFESINCVCPIYAASDRGRANLIGTGTLLDFGKARFLVTAAHVEGERVENNVALYAGTSGPLVELPQPFQSTVPPAPGNRRHDRLDFAFVRLSDPLADRIARGRFFLPFTLIGVNDNIKPRAHYVFTGFPASREKTDYKNKKTKPSRFCFTGLTIPPNRMSAIGLHPEAHIAVEFNRDEVHDASGNPGCFPCPSGMSGGAVWGGTGDFRRWFVQSAPQLVGIGIEHLQPHAALVAVRIHLILAAISKFHSDIAPFVPKRQGFDNEITIVPWKPLSQTGGGKRG